MYSRASKKKKRETRTKRRWSTILSLLLLSSNYTIQCVKCQFNLEKQVKAKEGRLEGTNPRSKDKDEMWMDSRSIVTHHSLFIDLFGGIAKSRRTASRRSRSTISHHQRKWWRHMQSKIHPSSSFPSGGIGWLSSPLAANYWSITKQAACR